MRETVSLLKPLERRVREEREGETGSGEGMADFPTLVSVGGELKVSVGWLSGTENGRQPATVDYRYAY